MGCQVLLRVRYEKGTIIIASMLRLHGKLLSKQCANAKESKEIWEIPEGGSKRHERHAAKSGRLIKRKNDQGKGMQKERKKEERKNYKIGTICVVYKR